MRRSRFTEEQIAFVAKQTKTGTAVLEVCRKLGVSEQTFYRWKKQYGGLGVLESKRLKLLEEEKRRLKQLMADLSLDKVMLQNVLAKKLRGLLVGGSWFAIWKRRTSSASGVDARCSDSIVRYTAIAQSLTTRPS